MPLFRKREKQPEAATGPASLFAVAPPGGRTYRIRDFGYDIRIPEGWRMGGEDQGGKGRPIFYRERDPHGAVRITRLQPEGDPIESARGASEKIRGMKGVMDFQTE